MRAITLQYKCGCMPNEVAFEMRSRLANEDIIDYMNRVQMAVSVDHNNRSPLCMSVKMDYLKMPVDEGEPIGSVKGGTA